MHDKFGGQMSSSSSSSTICMNELCGATNSTQWKRGWAMKAGGFAILCCACGTAYENANYCERFHLNEPGWRECKFCHKPIHCGCVVSKYLHEYHDLGGISCITCIRATKTKSLESTQSFPSGISNGFALYSGTWKPSIIVNRMNGGASFDKGKLAPLHEALEKRQHSPSTSSIGHQIKQEENRLSSKDFGLGFSASKDIGTIFPKLSSLFATPTNSRTNLGVKALYEARQSLGHDKPSLTYSLGNALGPTKSSSVHPIAGGIVEGREKEKASTFDQGQRSHLTFLKPSTPGAIIRSQLNKGMVSENGVARRPVEGRGSIQLLPRYWPKITDQELLQISGNFNSNSTVVPLFEKVLSASDAGRIGRLVLPKACAEAYFPPINQSEGLPIRIKDIKDKEWTFQFRFWPNNNSRMYVLEGVTPCIQNMQMQAGDTVIFSRLEPEGKLVIGCRKAPVSAETSGLPNSVPGGTSSSGGNGNHPMKNVENECMTNGDSVQRHGILEKKKTRNIGSKSKRLLMHSEDAMQLQELLRPFPNTKPNIVMIENYEFEEYDEPPVFGKRTVFTMHESGSQEQWGQCDNCSKWRKLPLNVLLPSKWTCSDNVWDPDRCLCSAPDEINTRELERIFRFGKESKKRKLGDKMVIEVVVEEQKPSALDALATAAVLGESVGEFSKPGESSSGSTKRHPRHRPGCTCIVCNQPPSGKGRHKRNCVCNVCMTVQRRFKTLMLRKKKRMMERKAALSQKSVMTLSGVAESVVRIGVENGPGPQLDLNSDPNKEEEMMPGAEAGSMTSLANSSAIHVDWHNMFTGVVPNGTSMKKEEHPCLPSRLPTHTPTDKRRASPVTPKLEIDKKVVESE